MSFAYIVRYVYRERNAILKHILTTTDSNFLSSVFLWQEKEIFDSQAEKESTDRVKSKAVKISFHQIFWVNSHHESI